MTSSRPAYRHRDFKAVLFDLDGVLTPTALVHRTAWRELFTDFLAGYPGVAPYTEEDYFALIDGRPRYEGVAALLASRGIELPEGTPGDLPGDSTICSLGNKKNALFTAILERDGIEPYAGSLNYVRQVIDAGLDVAVVSSSRNAHQVLERAGLATYFATVISGTEAAARSLAGKPAPDTFLAAAADLGWRPEECVVVEDATSGVAAAVSGGFKVVAIDRENNADQLSAAGAHVLVTDLQELITEQASDALNYDPWSIAREAQRDESGAQDTVFSLGNGFLGCRAAQVGVAEHTAGTFLNGLHETWQIRHAESAFGLAETGQTMISAPDFRTLRVFINDEALEIGRTELLRDDLRLDFRDGTLNATTLWRTAEGNRVAVTARTMVSFSDRHLAVQDLHVRLLDAPAHVLVQSSLIGEPTERAVPSPMEMDSGVKADDPRKSEAASQNPLIAAGHTQDGSRLGLSYYVKGSGMSVAASVEHQVTLTGGSKQPVRTTRQVNASRADEVSSVNLNRGQGLRLSKFAVYHASRRHSAEEMLTRSSRALDHLVPFGVDEHFRAQRAFMIDYWRRSDVVVDSDDKQLQRAIRWNLFQLAQASARSDGLGISAKGVSGNGYSGHYFWDTEIYVLPFLTYTNPQWARNALRARVSMLPAATRRAQVMNEDGILFPWRTINGEEASAYYPAGTAQYHINADVAYGLNRYLNASGDEEFLTAGGAEIMVGTARMWTSLGFWRHSGEQETFHIHGVTGPDEYTAVVNDNLYTNVMARFNLRRAAEIITRLADEYPDYYQQLVQRLDLQPEEPAMWVRAAHCMHIPYSESVEINPQDDHFLNREIWDVANTDPAKFPLLLHYHPLVIYRFQVIKQADTVLAMWLRSSDFSPERKLANFNYYDPLTTGDSTLSATVQSILAAEVGYRDLAYDYFEHALNVDLHNSHGNTADGVHVASTGGVWAGLVYGFGGLRDDEQVLRFDPRLPRGWRSMKFRLTWQGAQITVCLRPESISFDLCGAPALSVQVRRETIQLIENETYTVPLADQGPVREGRPSIEHVLDRQRENNRDQLRQAWRRNV
ncbi:beta-phosphoglucomutase family hydrolase [Glutamicibacter sp. PS]|uniref:beta-phosphoglucomutase family hydrolase n=1 Tax=Glutamicibacter sp. PS TaxID=3075634 RepID=UPI002840FA55|nr:beta-phosphoglucomutase family hydrolase [Glutamicibacter sp. PS]MDR4534869.1 beta-phosphoglucomutase family hydrolase [Glutamicibacter sp. PS]